MPDGGEKITVKTVSGIGEIDAAAWDSCAGSVNPFTRHAFFEALEQSGSASPDTGWLAQHVIAEDAAGRIVGAVPCYLKSHSYGEYVFDWGWADAYERAGRRYYPKLQVAVPFTPATGPRLLTPPGPNRRAICELLIAGLKQLSGQHEVSSLHVTFPTEEEYDLLGEAGFLRRMGQQFHWQNQGFETFDDFLDTLASRKRKQIRKERREAAANGIHIEPLTGDALKPEHMDAFYRFYLNTIDSRWSNAYLNKAFFHQLRETMADQIVLVMAERDGRYIAGALNLMGEDTLFGRNWGCIEEHRMLHFECCYYQAIDVAIAHKLDRVEAGAQGPHKISRGYLPCPTYSAHHIPDPVFRDAVSTFLAQERRQVEADMSWLAEARSPFKRSG